jgi:peroxiredoxin
LAKTFGIPVSAGGKATGQKKSGEAIEVVRGATIQRWTVVIDKAGNVAAIDEVGKGYAGDAKRVAELVKKLDTK